jgi:hypothetical protein
MPTISELKPVIALIRDAPDPDRYHIINYIREGDKASPDPRVTLNHQTITLGNLAKAMANEIDRLEIDISNRKHMTRSEIGHLERFLTTLVTINLIPQDESLRAEIHSFRECISRLARLGGVHDDRRY